jgi:hypothetical protein
MDQTSPLLALPRELRDMIIDVVLLAGYPAPDPNRKHAQQPNLPRIPWRSVPLLLVCYQLYAETHQRASKVHIPLILDILVTSNGTLQTTWLNVPWQYSWQKIRMEIKVRVQPIDLALIRDGNIRGEIAQAWKRLKNNMALSQYPLKPSFSDAKMRVRQRIVSRIGKQVHVALFSVLSAQSPSPRIWEKQQLKRQRPRTTLSLLDVIIEKTAIRGIPVNHLPLPRAELAETVRTNTTHVCAERRMIGWGREEEIWEHREAFW